MTFRNGAARSQAFEALREELLRNRDELLATARDYAKRRLFEGDAHNMVTSIIGKFDAYGDSGMTDRMWTALAGCVAYIDIRDEDDAEDEA